MRLKRFLCMVLAGMLVAGSVGMPVDAAELENTNWGWRIW